MKYESNFESFRMCRSYSGLMRHPAWLLYKKHPTRLVASVRARTGVEAKEIFRAHNLRGDYIKRGK